MKRIVPLLSLVAFLAACGGGEPQTETETPSGAETAPQPSAAAAMPEHPTGELTMPSWYQYDEASNTVDMTITAGATPDDNYWNYNGAFKGEMAISVPVGATVNITLVNKDPNMPHSVAIDSHVGTWSAAPTPDPAFEGAMTDNPTDMMNATMPGETESISFVADQAGEYSMVCYMPGHAATGMWVFFDVTDDGSAGVQGTYSVQ
jgi:sulfocyanin